MDRKRFEALWNRCRVDGVGGDAGVVFDRIHVGYSEPHRRYHTPAHIEHCLHQFDLATHLVDDSDAVEMALWFHDVIWQPDAAEGVNERDSADLFVELVGRSVTEAFRDKVYELIMITIHRALPVENDEKFIVDIDLSSFGLPWEEMLRDSELVRGEYPDVADADFFAKQRHFFERLLARPHFCMTEFFRKRYERSARENIGRHLQRIRDEGLA